jgi:hypothetical protein
LISPIVALIIYYVLRGNFYSKIFIALYIFYTSFKVNYKNSYFDLLYVILLTILSIGSLFTEYNLNKYLLSQFILLIISIIIFKNYKINEKSIILTKKILLYLLLFQFVLEITYLLNLIDNSTLNLLVNNGMDISFIYEFPKLYTVLSVSMLLCPFRFDYKQKLLILINMILTFSLPIILLYVITKIKRYLIIILSLISIIALLYVFDSDIINEFINQKVISISSREAKIGELNLFGQSDNYKDFSESLVIAISQGLGIIPCIIFLAFFFYDISMRSKSWKFILATAFLMISNPFPLCIIYIYSLYENLIEK